ncbi:MAG: NADP oxidoreductase [Desulfobulbus sp.]|jgi:NAD-reducing hydrogenase small subunit|uniref:NADH-quinone oxidoreductase subunit B family protein n=1 Tax=Desulfobulbus sp. TaxID=895 RepID=UPI002841DE68|nr:NADP oxidoreductase [Desulfobulbus sp.]MDR2550441.1 NADP oxidoreductase [Desulfobulbus sp.]
MSKLRLATLWLDGCSGCHMSLLDTDERLLELAAQMDIVYSPLVDTKQFPERVDVVCIEGAVSTEEDEARLRLVRQRSGLLIAMGDCAVTGNVPAMRNPLGAEAMLRAVYRESPVLAPQIPIEDLPRLHGHALPLHRFVPVDLFIPGCPPAADTLFAALAALIAGTADGLRLDTRFGA